MMIKTSPDANPIDRRNIEKAFRFSTDVEIFLIPNRDDITAEEIKASNYSEEEFGEIRQRERRLSRQLSRLGAVIDVNEDELGLESSHTKSRRKLRMQEGQMSVLLEQTLQSDINHQNPEYIANIYSNFTRESATLAHNRGLRVAEHVKIMSFCDSTSNISRKGRQRQHFVHSARWRSPTTDRAPHAPTLHILASRQPGQSCGQQQSHAQKYADPAITQHPWDQWAKHINCDSKETIQIRSRLYRVS